jgi:oxygen-independent coproporphyrinogen-3 oxidase
MVPTCGETTSGFVRGGLEPIEGNYFVATYPPFSCWRKELAGAVPGLLRTPGPNRPGEPFGLYVHIPFCAHRCQYCYYLSYAGKSRGQMADYLAALLRELAAYRDLPAFAGRKVGFVYFGGGTPSLLPAEDVRRLLAGLREIFPWDRAEEVTFECAPLSTTPCRVRELRAAGVNRVSLGVQQLDDAVLGLNHRVHEVEDVERAWAALREADFDEVNVDLIAGLVGETEDSFRDGLERVLRMEPDSVTIYQLEIPLNTPLYRALHDGHLAGGLPSWETKRARLAHAFDRLEAHGYALRSAYAAARNRRHRRFVYQEEQYRGADLLGIGAASFSYVNGVHYQNVTSLGDYLARMAEGGFPIGRAYVLSAGEQLVREFVLQLKLGLVEAARFRDRFGVEISDRFGEPLKHLAGRGWLTYDRAGVALTRAGLLRVDRLLPAFYLPEHRGLRYS